MKKSTRISHAVETPEPRPSKRRGVPWEYAIELCGGLTALKKSVSDNVAWNWKDRGLVPAEHVLTVYIERVRAAGGQPAPEPYAGLEAPLVERLELTQKYYDLMGSSDGWWAAMGAAMESTLTQHAATEAAKIRRLQRRSDRRAKAG